MTRRLIVNADDLGRTEGVNEGVFEAHRRGIVTSATLMVNYPAAASVPALASKEPGLGIGLHLQMSGGAPRLPPARVPSLVGEDGLLPRKPDGLAEADPAEVLAEAWAQLEAFRALMGRDPTHVDSHHHSHRVPSVFAAAVALAREAACPVRLAAPSMAALLAREGIRSSDRFDESFFDAGATVEKLVEVLRTLPSGTTELMCHPARADDELRSTSSYALPRERELAVLTSDAVREAVRASGITLVSYATFRASNGASR